jgi:hypothetical protein
MTLPPYTPQPPIKQRRGLLFWLAAGCGGCLTLLVAFVVVIYAVVVMAMRSATPVRDALRLANADPRAVAALGQPIEPGLLFFGKLNVDNQEGAADISFSVSGPKGDGKMKVVATKGLNNWTYTQMVLTPDSGPPIDLITK